MHWCGFQGGNMRQAFWLVRLSAYHFTSPAQATVSIRTRLVTCWVKELVPTANGRASSILCVLWPHEVCSQWVSLYHIYIQHLIHFLRPKCCKRYSTIIMWVNLLRTLSSWNLDLSAILYIPSANLLLITTYQSLPALGTALSSAPLDSVKTNTVIYTALQTHHN